MTDQALKDADHCTQEVRAHDPDRWLCALFAPDAARPHLCVLYALNLELARVSSTVREPMLGQIRLQWWREAIEGAAGGAPRAHPVVRALAAVMADGGLNVSALTALVDAREPELNAAELLADLPAVIAWAEGTGGALATLSAKLLSADPLPAVAEAGTAAALTGLLRNAEHGQALVPEALNEAIRAEAVRRLSVAQGTRLPRAAVAAALPAALARLYLRAPHATPLQRQWALLKAATFRRV